MLSNSSTIDGRTRDNAVSIYERDRDCVRQTTAAPMAGALALRDLLRNENACRVMVVSTDIHMRRVALTFSKVFRNTPVLFFYRPVPPTLSSVQKERWWTRSADRRYVLSEIIKLAGYPVILSTPEWFRRWLMRLGKTAA
jgi:hypothetical protein